MLISSSSKQVVEKFLDDASLNEATAALKDLQQLLSMGISEEDLSQYLKKAGCYYWPGGSGQTSEEWLREVAAQLQEAIG
jgi:contact-dependent growth inhibition (CDI) system CdiI-like immunity protein